MKTSDRIADIVIRLSIGIPILLFVVPISLPVILIQEFTERLFEPFLWRVLDVQSAYRRWAWKKYQRLFNGIHSGPR
jgi:hypothetical protein